MSDVLRTSDLSKRFRATPVLNQLNLTVPEGSVYALVGPNGAGKTTCIKILMNLLRATSGHAEVFGQDSRRLTARLRADRLRVGKSGTAGVDDHRIFPGLSETFLSHLG